MGCSNSTQAASMDPETASANSASKAIDSQLKADYDKQRNTIKMLFLGTGESGKSTMLKQMQLIYGQGFDQSEREAYTGVIRSNLVQSAQLVLDALPFLKIDLPADRQSDATHIQSIEVNDLQSLDGPTQKALVSLWSADVFKEAVSYGQSFQLNDSATFFFDHIEEICQDSYVPPVAHLLRARVRSTGIVESHFQVQHATFQVFDVGGQRSERRKWIHLFEGVQVLLFLVAISEYDQTLFEDENVPRVDEAVSVFSSIVNSRWFAESTIILFANKIDLFDEKLRKLPLQSKYPDFRGRTVQDARQFMADLFLNVSPPERHVYHHFTCATDTESLKVVLRSVQETILLKNIKTAGFV